MGKLFDLLEMFSSVISWFVSLLTQIWSIITTCFNVAVNVFVGCPPSLYVFFTLFVTLSLGMFIWRLIP